MKATVKTQIGPTVFIFEIDENEEMETLNRAATLGNPPDKCDECGNDTPNDFRLDSNKDKEANVYVNVVCKNCGAKAKLGQYKAKGYFWHKFKKWEGSQGNGEPQQTKQAGGEPPPIDDDSLPF